MKKVKALFYLLLSISTFNVNAQSNDSAIIRNIYNFSLTNSTCYQNLEFLCKQIGPRLSGSSGASKAIDFTKTLLTKAGYDTVFLQPTMVPCWVRGEKETAAIQVNGKNIALQICALGGSIKTPNNGLSAEVVEVKSFEELASLGRKAIEGKIVFFNRAMDPTKIETFGAYGGAVNQRGSGASQAAKYGAVGCVVRSMNLRIDDYPHTGAMRYDTAYPKIPCVAISTFGANLLSDQIKANNKLKFSMKTNCETKADVLSYNVVAEIRGAETPENIILIGGHLDSWDLAEGAHDDGAGCVQSMEILNTFQKLNIKPKNTIRVVLFINEENGLRGGVAYAKEAAIKKEKHLIAIESDEGGFTPRGFSIDASKTQIEKIASWKNLLEEYGLYDIRKGGGGADIGPLKDQGVPLISFKPDSQRYFDMHHAATDVFEAVNKRELELGAASISSLVYLIDKYGL